MRYSLFILCPLLAALCLLAEPGRAQNPQSAQARALTGARVEAFKSELAAQAGGGAIRVRTGETGHIRSFSMPAGKAAALKSATAGLSAEAVARAFLSENRELFHSGVNLVDYQLKRLNSAAGRRQAVKLDQTYGGLRVFGAQAIVQVERGGVSSVQSALMTRSPLSQDPRFSLTPAVGISEARQLAIDSAERNLGEVAATTPTLEIYDPALLHNSGSPQLAWNLELQSVSGAPLHERVLLNARTGKVAFRYTLLEQAKNRMIYDAQSTSNDPGTLVRSEGGAASGLADADLAYQYFGDTYDFYYNHHGRNSINNAGLTLSATVRFCPVGEDCPYENAYWDSNRMYFGAGFASADDVIGHELTHGVTENESGLIYANQPGAINESFSDMWGEWIDLENGSGTDTAATRWQMGEDLPASIGVIRDMSDPPLYGDPDKMSSSNWYSGSGDSGGVHYNSGVGNKLCYLLTDGDTFNGHTNTGLGIAKAAQLMYEVQCNLLTPSADYAALYDAITQAAINVGFTQAEKDSVEQACEAVEINTAVTTPPPSNDECANAITLSSGVSYTSSSLGATGAITSSCGESTDYLDVWFKFTPASSGTMNVNTNGSVVDTVLSIYNACGGTELACNDYVSTSDYVPSVINLTVTGGVTYYIRLAGYNSETGAYTITATGPSSGGGTGGGGGTGVTASLLGGGVCINELLPDPNSGSYNYDTDGNGTANTTDEFIELYNAGGSTIDISNWQLWRTSNGNWFTFPSSSTLAPGKFAVVVVGVQSGGALPAVTAGNLAFNAGKSTGMLGNSGDNVVLLNPASNQYIQCIYDGDSVDAPTSSYTGFPSGATRVGTAEDFGAATDGSSLVRYPDGTNYIVVSATQTGGSILATPGSTFSVTPVELSSFSLE